MTLKNVKYVEFLFEFALILELVPDANRWQRQRNESQIKRGKNC